MHPFASAGAVTCKRIVHFFVSQLHQRCGASNTSALEKFPLMGRPMAWTSDSLFGDQLDAG
jgi:hypothetical protein